MKRFLIHLLLVGTFSPLVACSSSEWSGYPSTTGATEPAATAPAPSASQPSLNLTGSYTCTFAVVDDDVYCGGIVYRSHLQGQAVPLTVAQTGSSVEIGAWGAILHGTVTGQTVDAKVISMSAAPDDLPLVHLTGTGGERQLRGLVVTMDQNVGIAEDCHKEWHGSCARN